MKLENVYESARHAYYVDQGMLKLNSLAEEQCEYLYEHYEELIVNFEKDGINAFVREQIEWLGFNNAEEIIGESMEKLTQKVCKIIDEYIDRDLDAGENEKLREAVRLGLKELLESSDQRENEEVKKIIVDMGKKTSKDRRFSEERFNTIMGILGLEYSMEKDKGISRISKTATEES